MSLPSLDFSLPVAILYSCFGFLDFDLIQFMNLFLFATLPLHKSIFLSLCGFLNPLIPPAPSDPKPHIDVMSAIKTAIHALLFSTTGDVAATQQDI